MRAIFQIIANARDITDLLKDRLISLQLTDRSGLQSEECEIRLDDRDDRIAFPRKCVLLRISLGWEGQGLSFMGAYTVDEIEFSGPPRTLTIRGKPADMACLAKSPREHARENVPLLRNHSRGCRPQPLAGGLLDHHDVASGRPGRRVGLELTDPPGAAIKRHGHAEGPQAGGAAARRRQDRLG